MLQTTIQKTKKYIRHILHKASLSGLVGIIVIFIVIAMVVGSVQSIQQNFQGQLKVDELKQKVAVLDLEVQTQRLQNQYYATSEYSELQARRLLNKAAPGEHVIILPPSTIARPADSPQVVQSKASSASIKDRSNLEQWLYFLFSNKNNS